MDRFDLEAAALRLTASLECLAALAGHVTSEAQADLPREGLASLFDLLAGQAAALAQGAQTLKDV